MINRIISRVIAFLPWQARKTISAIRQIHARRFHPFTGRVVLSAGEFPDQSAYEMNSWAAACAEAARRIRENIGNTISVDVTGSRALLPAAIGTLSVSLDRPVRVLDFGGGAGIDYANVLAAGDANDVRYHIVENQIVCERAAEVWKDDGRITFSANVPDDTERFDIVYACSAIYTVKDYRSLLASFAALEPRIILLLRSPITENTFVRLQNFHGVTQGQWVFGLNELRQIMGSHGYRLALKAFSEDDYNVDNFERRYKVEKTVNLMFVKTGTH